MDALRHSCSAAEGTLRAVPGPVSIPLPDDLGVDPAYGTVMSGWSAAAMRLALFMLSPEGQAIPAENGLPPIVAP